MTVVGRESKGIGMVESKIRNIKEMEKNEDEIYYVNSNSFREEFISDNMPVHVPWLEYCGRKVWLIYSVGEPLRL